MNVDPIVFLGGAWFMIISSISKAPDLWEPIAMYIDHEVHYTIIINYTYDDRYIRYLSTYEVWIYFKC